MICKICTSKHTNKVYCSQSCSNKGKFGRKRPDVAIRMKTNHPSKNPIYRQRMIDSLKGRKQPQEVVKKRMKTMKEVHKNDPTLRFRQTQKVVELAKKKPKSWAKIKIDVLMRDKHTCQECNHGGKRLVVHHIDHRGRNLPYLQMNNDMANLISLCYSCHNRIHMWATRREMSAA